MVWSCMGMAYFNAISTLDLDPTISVVSAALPIALFVGWNARSRPSNNQRPNDQRLDKP